MTEHIEPYFSVARRRRRQWQGHETKANVRNVIASARRDGRQIRIYISGIDAEGWRTFTMVQPEDWDSVFAEGEVKPNGA